MSKCFITCEQGHLCDFRENVWQRKRHLARRMDRGKLNGTFIDIILTPLVDLKCHTNTPMTSMLKKNGRTLATDDVLTRNHSNRLFMQG